MKKINRKLYHSKYWWVFLILLLLGVNWLASTFHARYDLTREKRYTLSGATRDFIKNLDDDVEIDVFLTGDFPSGFRKLANSTEEFLRLIKDRNGSKIHYRFLSPEDPMPGTQMNYGDSLVNLGAVPINLTVQKKAGESSNIIFPVAIMRYKEKLSMVNLYPGASGRISQEEINSAEALMEYQFINSLNKLTQEDKPGIAYSTGNGEPQDARTYDMLQTLTAEYKFATLNINRHPVIPSGVDILLIVKPTIAFTEEEKFKIDQFVMRGGRLLCFIDNLIAEQDSLAYKPEQVAYDRNLNLTDLFFRYGIRINTDLVMDLQCDLIPFIVGGTEDNPQYEFLRWNYYPLLLPAENSINRNMGYIASRYANSIDTIQVAGVSRTPLLVSSENSRSIRTPALISLNENKNVPEDDQFKTRHLPVGMLLEGNFTSLYNNRVTSAQRDSLRVVNAEYRSSSVPNKMIVVADGNIVLNDVISQGAEPVPLPMGYNKYTYAEYQKQSELGKLFIPVANRQFLQNSIEYLVNDPAISETRNKDIVLRLLDTQKVTEQKTTWQLINIAAPLLLVIICGLVYQELRRRNYAS